MSETSKNESLNKRKRAPFAEAVSRTRHAITDHPGRTALTLTLAASAAAGITGLANMEGGNDNGAERGEIATDIYAVTLAPDANLRFDPYVGDGEESTFIAQPGEEVTVIGESRIRVLEDTNNGTWYGLSSSWLADAIPNFNDGGDKDGIIWVNEQGVTHVTHLEDVDIQLPDTPAYEDDSDTKKP